MILIFKKKNVFRVAKSLRYKKLCCIDPHTDANNLIHIFVC